MKIVNQNPRPSGRGGCQGWNMDTHTCAAGGGVNSCFDRRMVESPVGSGVVCESLRDSGILHDRRHAPALRTAVHGREAKGHAAWNAPPQNRRTRKAPAPAQHPRRTPSRDRSSRTIRCGTAIRRRKRQSTECRRRHGAQAVQSGAFICARTTRGAIEAKRTEFSGCRRQSGLID